MRAPPRLFREKARELVKEREVVRQEVANVWALHLDHDRPSVAQFRGMHLTKAGGADGLGVERSKQLADPRVQLRLDDLFDGGDGNLVDVVLQLFQLLDVRRRQKIRPRGKDLAELDVGGSQLDESPPEREGSIRRPAVVLAGLRLVRQAVEALLLGKIGQAIPREQADGRGEAG